MNVQPKFILRVLRQRGMREVHIRANKGTRIELSPLQSSVLY
jgi:hypothetical protein